MLGLMTALLCAHDGVRVTVIERRAGLWQGTSAAGEGKVHLGPVYAMGGSGTARVMLRGALRFADLVERAIGTTVDWDDLCTETFTYIVMPDSLMAADEVARAYRRMNAEYADARSAPGDRYLGGKLETLIDTKPSADGTTGFPAFQSRERCVDPLRLGAIVERAVREHPRIDVLTGNEVVDVNGDDGEVRVRGADQVERSLGRFAAIVNCAWDGRAQLEVKAGVTPPMQSVRVKASVRLAPSASDRAVTLVQGPYGDVVRHRDHTYVSWYPLARVHHEHVREPSPSVPAAVSNAAASRDLAAAQISALASLGLVADDADVRATAAGVVLGHGDADIHLPTSGLHHRAHFGVRVRGRMMTPDNYKFTTAPLAADEVRRMIVEGMPRGRG